MSLRTFCLDIFPSLDIKITRSKQSTIYIIKILIWHPNTQSNHITSHAIQKSMTHCSPYTRPSRSTRKESRYETHTYSCSFISLLVGLLFSLSVYLMKCKDTKQKKTSLIKAYKVLENLCVQETKKLQITCEYYNYLHPDSRSTTC
jgi:hypothetical protein